MQNIMVLPARSGLSVRTKQLIAAFGGTAVEFAAASFLHFLWDWTGQFYASAVFASVNESVWEHLKIMLWPYFFWSFAIYAILKTDPKRLITARILGIIAITGVTISIFYIYSGIIGYSIPAVDITLAFIALLIGELVSIRAVNSPVITGEYYTIAAAALVLIIVMLLCFTVNAPKIGLFRDPTTGTYGIIR